MRDSQPGQFSSISTDDVPRFNSSIENGLRFYQVKKGCRAQVSIGKHLVAIASIQNRQGDRAALLLEFESIQREIKRCIVRREDLVSCGGEKIFASLLARGYYYRLEYRDVILDYLSGLGGELPEIIADGIDRIAMDLSKLVFDVVNAEDEDYEDEDEDEDIDSRRF
jgi:hypothetical protein